MKNISEIDSNFQTKSAAGGTFHSVDLPPFVLYGVQKDADGYYRMPPEIAANVSDSVNTLNRQTAGGLVRFRTNAPKMSLRASGAVCNGIMAHMTALGSAGFDLFCGEAFIASFPPCSMPLGTDYSAEKVLYLNNAVPDADGFYEMTLYFPLYGAYREISLSIPDGYEFRAPRKAFRNQKPVVFYGSSITQGGCAPTPGMGYTNILSRYLNAYCINLGFSGSAKAEDSMIGYLASLDMEVFVLDYDHNAPNAAHLEATHEKLFAAVRSAHPALPIVILSSIPFYSPDFEQEKRRDIIRKTYENACAAGDENVYFIDGASFFTQVPFDMATVDGCHPNGLGMYLMAEGVRKVLEPLL